MARIPRNTLIAAAIAILVTLWMVSGMWSDHAPAGTAEPNDASRPAERFLVEFTESTARAIELRVVAQGQVKPERFATLSTQTGGAIETVRVETGQRVEEGAVLVGLAMDDRQARLAEAEALLRQRLRENEAAQRLGESGFQSEVLRDEAAAELAAARARLRSIELEIEHTLVRAPFAGVVGETLIEVGDFAPPRTPVATLVDNDPLVAEAFLSQRHFDVIEVGATARVTLVSGDTVAGTIVSVAPRADESTRTLRVEIQVPNPGGVPANTSAEIEIPTGSARGHRLSPALLELDDEGRIGVKTVSEDERVEFFPVEIVRSDARGVWVTGLPATVRIITAGAGFVSPGQAVEARAADNPADNPGEGPA